MSGLGKTQKVYLGDVRIDVLMGDGEGYVGKRIRRRVSSGFGRSADAEIEALTNEQVRSVVVARFALPPEGGKVKYERPVLLWFVVLGIFCGIRPHELTRMKREWVNLEELTVTVPARSSKTRQRRVVDLSENAAAWLALDPLREGPIVPTNERALWNRLREQAGWRAPAWTHRKSGEARERGAGGKRSVAAGVAA
jgi:integrase